MSWTFLYQSHQVFSKTCDVISAIGKHTLGKFRSLVHSQAERAKPELTRSTVSVTRGFVHGWRYIQRYHRSVGLLCAYLILRLARTLSDWTDMQLVLLSRDALDIADTSLTSLSDDLMERLSIPCCEKKKKNADYYIKIMLHKLTS